MVNRHRLAEILRPLAQQIATDEQLRQQRAAAFAINADGSINAMAITNVLPWQSQPWWLPGATTTGNGQGMEFPVPQNILVKRIDVRCKTGPVSQNLIVRVRAGGTTVDTVTVQKGATAGSSSGNTSVAAGSVLRVDIMQTGGSDVTVVVHYTIDPGVL